MRLLVSGGGTGGHVYPAISLIKYVKEVEPNSEFMYVGTARGMESKIVAKEGLPFATIDIQGFKRSLSAENIKTIQKFLKSIKESKRIIKEFKPDVVVGTGGYVCAPVVYAAKQLGIPTVIHEQNSVPGVANKFLARYVDKIAVCFEEAKAYFPEKKVSMTGNPRAQEVANLTKNDHLVTHYQLDDTLPTVLIFGGSRGAKTMMTAVKAALPELEKKDYQTLIGTGSLYYDDVVADIDFSCLKKVKVLPYIDQMTTVLANVDLVVSRAGATSIAEFTGIGLPSLLIPSPNVTNDHQTKNAMSLVNAGAADLLKDSELSKDNLIAHMDELMNNQAKLAKMKKQAQQLGVQNATELLYDVLKEIQK